MGGIRYHVALYDAPGPVADLYALAVAAFPSHKQDLVESTTDGRHFASGPSFWRCFAGRSCQKPVAWPLVNHWGHRCHSVFGCALAQGRQHDMYSSRGLEVFYPRRHGHFSGDVFVFDREKIRAEVLGLIQAGGGHRCPLFRPSSLDDAIRCLPGYVDPSKPLWEFFDCKDAGGPAVGFRCYETVTFPGILAQLTHLSG